MSQGHKLFTESQLLTLLLNDNALIWQVKNSINYMYFFKLIHIWGDVGMERVGEGSKKLCVTQIYWLDAQI